MECPQTTNDTFCSVTVIKNTETHTLIVSKVISLEPSVSLKSIRVFGMGEDGLL